MDGRSYYELTQQTAKSMDIYLPPWEELGAQAKTNWEQIAHEQECSDRGQPRLQEVDND